jgi:hypothetical protein
VGLVIGYRQSLVTTYLFYQALAWLGDAAGQWLVALERAPGARARAEALARALGRIEVLAETADGWVPAGSAGETGPLATDVKLVPLPRLARTGPVRVRLRMAQGLWRVDYVAVAPLGARVEPARVRPAAVFGSDVPPAAAAAWIADSTRPLVTLPGDTVTIEFRLADAVANAPYGIELFLEARGYYLEWMREGWLAEQDPGRAARLYLDPAGALRELAPAFKRLEGDLERRFWSSRYARP